MKRVTVDVDACAGCRVCELACSGAHTGRYQPSESRVTVVKHDSEGFDYPAMCHQCEECTAAPACPTGALTRNSGVVSVDEAACVQCSACVAACKHQAVRLGASTPLFCDLCGGDPACVAKCPTKALGFSEAPEPEPVDAIKAAQRGRWRL